MSARPSAALSAARVTRARNPDASGLRPQELELLPIALPRARTGRNSQKPGLVRERLWRGEDAGLQDRCAPSLLGIADRFISNQAHRRLAGNSSQRLRRAVIVRIGPFFRVAGEGLAPQIYRGSRELDLEKRVGGRPQAGQPAALHHESPSPVAELRTGSASFIGRVKDPWVPCRPETRSTTPGWIAKGRGEKVIQAGRRGRRPGLRCLEEVFEDRLLGVA